MSESFTAGDSSGVAVATADSGSPTAPVPSVSSSPGTIAQAEGSTDPAPGPVPYERFNEVNTKYAQLKWAEGLDTQSVRQQQQFFQWLQTDPEGAFKYMEDYLTRSGALKRPQQAAQPDARPQPDVVVPETGQKFYSAEAAEKLSQWIAKQSTQPLEQRLQSIEHTHAQTRAQAAAQHKLAEAASWPYYTEHQQEILRTMENDHRLSLEGAYQRVVLPKMRQLERQAVLSEINQKSQASTVNPGAKASAQSQPTAKMGWTDLFKRELAKRSA